MRPNSRPAAFTLHMVSFLSFRTAVNPNSSIEKSETSLILMLAVNQNEEEG
jgi:hypothetical protein